MNENAAVYFVDRHVTEGRAAKTAFREADGARRSLTYGDLADQAAHFAGALYRHGVRREERIAMVVRDQIEFPVVFWGAMKAGAIPVPLNTLLSASVYEAILNDSRASILVVSEQLWETVRPAVDGNRYLRPAFRQIRQVLQGLDILGLFRPLQGLGGVIHLDRSVFLDPGLVFCLSIGAPGPH